MSSFENTSESRFESVPESMPANTPAAVPANTPAATPASGTESMPEKSTRPWKPNKERKVRSKRALDAQKMARLKESARHTYKGELDPRGLPAKDERKPRAISRSEERVQRKAERLAKNDPTLVAKQRRDQLRDFRGFFEPCKATPARLAALYVTNQVRRRHAYAQEVIEATIDQSQLSAEDRAFATLLALGVVSMQGSLDEVLNRCMNKPTDVKNDVRDALRISTYEIIYLRKAPHAALDQGVELVRAVAPSAARLANAILHRVLEQVDIFPYGDPRKDGEALALMYGFPPWLAKYLISFFGTEDAIAFMAASNEPAPLFVAVNALRATDFEVIDTFAGAGADIEPVSVNGREVPGCYRVAQPRVLTDGRVKHLFDQGKVLVSDAAAQAVAACVIESVGEDVGGAAGEAAGEGVVGVAGEAAGEGAGEPVGGAAGATAPAPATVPNSLLEIGAGRGTKTILLQSDAWRAFGAQLDLTPLDLHEYKNNLLQARCETYDAHVHVPITGNATRLDSVIGDARYACVFVDAPCSGLGTLRRHHEIRWRLTREQVDELAATNLAILKSAANHVAPGGSLIYATCTVTYKENFGTVRAFLASKEGAAFKLAPLRGKSCFFTKLTPSSPATPTAPAVPASPDAHFAAKFIRVSD